ncbi:MAG: hypothetical protein GWN62_22845 [Aliifodinibius sp.]|nr:hypothetical protein [Fodinibius sp.]
MFVSDLASYAVHFARKAWVTAYDIEPLETIKTKKKWQKWALENSAILIFQHDTHIRQGHLVVNPKGKKEIEVLQSGSLEYDH